MTAAVGPLHGTRQVVRFNWPKYGVVLLAALGAIAAVVAGRSPLLIAVLLLVAVPGLVWSVTSLVATWWVYDHRDVYGAIAEGLGEVGEWANVHAGLDDGTPVLVAALAVQPAAVIELAVPPGPTLRRARDLQPSTRPAGSAVDRLPGADGSLDTVFVTFAAHEVRAVEDQRALFAELGRLLRPGGRLVLAEHVVDLPNLLVFGPAAFHFRAARVWRARAAEAGLVPVGVCRLTPFVRRLLWSR
jgi:SAM-dependent methyltransferase